jgi:serine/threonine protein kinase
MNRSIDSRSDLYAFGAILYQLLVGEVPFVTVDLMELVHCHIAQPPIPPSERSAAVPKPVSEIVMKLLAKAAEDRCQTAAGVEAGPSALSRGVGGGPVHRFLRAPT